MQKAKNLVRTNILFDSEMLKSIDAFATDMLEDRSTVIRQLVRKALISEKIEGAVKKFQEGVSFRKSAEIAGLDYWDFQAELDKRNIPVSSSLSFARQRLKQI